jgi:hypothetical protein
MAKKGGGDYAPLEERQARYDRIAELRRQNLTYEQIGEQLDPPLTKERVRQIHLRPRPRQPGRPRKEPVSNA